MPTVSLPWWRVKLILAALSLLLPECAMAQEAVQLPAWAKQQRFVEKHEFLMMLHEIARGDQTSGKELELSDTQLADLHKTIDGYSAELSRMTSQMRRAMDELGPGATDEQRSTLKNELDKAYSALADKTLVVLDSSLLPHQIARLNQLVLQSRLLKEANGDEFRALLLLSSKLELTKEEADRFESDLKKIAADYKKELDDLRLRYRDRVSESLPEHARKKLEEVIGDTLFSGK